LKDLSASLAAGKKWPRAGTLGNDGGKPREEEQARRAIRSLEGLAGKEHWPELT
jgi:hypothetical protein